MSSERHTRCDASEVCCPSVHAVTLVKFASVGRRTGIWVRVYRPVRFAVDVGRRTTNVVVHVLYVELYSFKAPVFWLTLTDGSTDGNFNGFYLNPFQNPKRDRDGWSINVRWKRPNRTNVGTYRLPESRVLLEDLSIQLLKSSTSDFVTVLHYSTQDTDIWTWTTIGTMSTAVPSPTMCMSERIALQHSWHSLIGGVELDEQPPLFPLHFCLRVVHGRDARCPATSGLQTTGEDLLVRASTLSIDEGPSSHGGGP